MKADDKHGVVWAAMAEVRDCADTMEERAARLLQALPMLPIAKGLQATGLELGAGLKDASSRVTFELALLQVELDEAKADAATAVERLSRMDATMMEALAAVTDFVDQLETAAERDWRQERAFVLVIETVGIMLQGLEKAKAATQALGAAVRTDPTK